MLKIIVPCLLLLIRCSGQQDDRRIPPYFLEKPTPSDHYEAKQTTISLRCRAAGIPEPTISWYLDDKPLPNDASKYEFGEEEEEEVEGGGISSSLTFKSDAQGRYRCQAENKFGVAVSEDRWVRTAFLKPPNAVPEVHSVLEGKSICFNVKDPGSGPAVNFHWYKLTSVEPETKELALNERMYIDTRGRLCFGYTLKEDSSLHKLYKGKCKNEVLDQSYSCGLFNLTVNDGPTGEPEVIEASIIHSSPSNIVVLENKTMILECFIPSRPFEKVTWSRANRRPLPDRAEADEWGYRVTVKNVRPEDAGAYHCQSGKIRHTMTVSVEAAPVFHDPPRDRNVTEGSDVVVNCSTHAVPPATVEWFINSTQISRDRAIKRMSISDDTQTLLIRGVCRDCGDDRATDSSVIQCRAKNKHGTTFSSAFVNVLRKTEVALTSGLGEYVMETGYEEATVALNCSASSDPLTPVTPRWFHVIKNHKELLTSDSEGMFIKDGLLTFVVNSTTPKSWKSYAGEYACIADNGYSSSSMNTKITVRGISPVMASIMNFWWIIAVALALLLLLAIGLTVQCLYNVGDSYNVNKNELKNGNNPIKEIEEKDFKIYSRPEPVDFRGSQATLLSKSSRHMSENDVYPGRFTEDGSFLGVYTEERHRSYNELA